MSQGNINLFWYNNGNSFDGFQNPTVSKVHTGHELWLEYGEKVVVIQADPIRDEITVEGVSGFKTTLSSNELLVAKPQHEASNCKRAKKSSVLVQHSETHGDMEGTPTSMTDPAIETPEVRKRNHPIHGVRPQDPTNFKPNELEFTVYIQQSSGIVLRIGSVYFIESCTTPFFISRIFTSGIQGETMVTCLHCILSGDQHK
jgi:hypothetical protein